MVFGEDCFTVRYIQRFASGIDVGATVRVAGIEVGEVEEIDLSYDKDQGQAEIILSVWVNKDAS